MPPAAPIREGASDIRTAGLINHLLLHPDVELDGLEHGTDGSVEWAVSPAAQCGAEVRLTVTPVRGQCVACGTVVRYPAGTHGLFCSNCAVEDLDAPALSRP